MPVTSDRALAKFLGNVYTHVFQRVERNPNRPLNKTSHIREQQQVSDEIKSRLMPNTLTYKWGPGFPGDEAPTASSDSSARWGYTGEWA